MIRNVNLQPSVTSAALAVGADVAGCAAKLHCRHLLALLDRETYHTHQQKTEKGKLKRFALALNLPSDGVAMIRLVLDRWLCDLEEAQLVLIVGYEHVLRLAIVVEHHLMGFAAEA